MSQTDLSKSFLRTGLPEDTPLKSFEDIKPVESPELDFSAVESPTVDSPTLFEYEGPFGIGPRPDDDLWFETRRRERREMRLEERRMSLDFYENFDFGNDGSIKLKRPDVDIDFDFDFDVDLREFGVNLPEFDPKLKLDELLPRINMGHLLEKGMLPDLGTPDGLSEFFSGITSGLENLVSSVDFNNLESFKADFDGYGTAGKAAYSALSQTLNFRKDPSLQNAEALLGSLDDASTAFEKMGFKTGSDLAKLSPKLSGLILDVGAVSDIAALIDDPSLTNAAQAYGSANYLLENFTDVGSLPGSQSNIADIAGNAVTVINAAVELDDFFKDPSLEGALTTSAAVANAAAVFGSTQTAATAANIASALNPVVAAYTAFNVIKALTHDADYSRSEGSVDYSNGKFSATSVRGADGGAFAYTHWADAHTSTAATALNSLINDYGFTVDEKKMATIWNRYDNKSYMTNNPAYAKQGGRNHSSSNVDMVLSLLKDGALKPGENTPYALVQDETTFGSFMGNFFKQMTNDAAEYMYDNRGFVSQKYEYIKDEYGEDTERRVSNTTYLPFADRQSAESYVSRVSERDPKIYRANVDTGPGQQTKDGGLFFDVTTYSINSDNSLTPTVTRYEAGFVGRYGPVEDRNSYSETFNTEDEAKAFIAANSQGLSENYFAYTLHDGKYIIGRNKPERVSRREDEDDD
tara:strand:+ start:153 stop:2234 length:2082 start_codon:yes stop_codon:yes gene_type:complete